jgi:ribosomal protein S18 acetylase RimI-like enzyme
LIKIRLAHTEELEIAHKIVRDATRHLDEQEILQWDEIYPNKEILLKDIESQQMHFIEIEGRVVGLIVINEDQSSEFNSIDWKYSGETLVVHRLTIDPVYQRRGLANILMNFAEESAAVNGYSCIRLDAFIHNPAAFTLYEKRGYRNAGIVRFRKGEFYCFEKRIKV